MAYLVFLNLSPNKNIMLIEDCRIGGTSRYILADGEGPLMLVPDEMRKCVVYIGYRMANGCTRMAGSAFYVGRIAANDLPEIMLGYVVTAGHVITGIREKGLTKVLLRANFKAGTAQWIETDLDKWKVHPNLAVDIAVLRRSVAEAFDHRLWPVDGFVIRPGKLDDTVGNHGKVKIKCYI